MISVVVVGAAGRMGRAIEAAASGRPDLRIKARVDRPGEGLPGPSAAAPGYGGARTGPSGAPAGGETPLSGALETADDSLEQVVDRGDVVIEFSSPSGAALAARICAARGAALVSGSTGLGTAEEAAIRAAAERVAVLRAANFSLGILALRRALAAALVVLPGWDVEIVERHHRRKVDSPSGTAFLLAQEAARQRGLDATAFRFGREGPSGPRPEKEIGIHAVRGGSWTGDHAVLLAGDGESLELRHVAEDRAAFAHGALAAASFVAAAAPGLYTLDHLVDGGRVSNP